MRRIIRMSLLISKCYKKEGSKRKARSLFVCQKMTNSPEIKYLEMLNQGCKELAAKKFKAQRHIEVSSAKLIREMNDGECIKIAIINFRIEFIEKELEECQQKIYNDNKKVEGWHLSKKQREVVMKRITDLKNDLKNLFK